MQGGYWIEELNGGALSKETLLFRIGHKQGEAALQHSILRVFAARNNKAPFQSKGHLSYLFSFPTLFPTTTYIHVRLFVFCPALPPTDKELKVFTAKKQEIIDLTAPRPKTLVPSTPGYLPPVPPRQPPRPRSNTITTPTGPLPPPPRTNDRMAPPPLPYNNILAHAPAPSNSPVQLSSYAYGGGYPSNAPLIRRPTSVSSSGTDMTTSTMESGAIPVHYDRQPIQSPSSSSFLEGVQSYRLGSPSNHAQEMDFSSSSSPSLLQLNHQALPPVPSMMEEHRSFGSDDSGPTVGGLIRKGGGGGGIFDDDDELDEDICNLPSPTGCSTSSSSSSSSSSPQNEAVLLEEEFMFGPPQPQITLTHSQGQPPIVQWNRGNPYGAISHNWQWETSALDQMSTRAPQQFADFASSYASLKPAGYQYMTTTRTTSVNPLATLFPPPPPKATTPPNNRSVPSSRMVPPTPHETAIARLQSQTTRQYPEGHYPVKRSYSRLIEGGGSRTSQHQNSGMNMEQFYPNTDHIVKQPVHFNKRQRSNSFIQLHNTEY